jgi:type II secretory pathway pseudopilin PulG
MNTRAGFTYLEVLLATIIVAGAAITAAHALATVRDADESDRIRLAAERLLQDGIVAVRRLPRLDPRNPVYGFEPGETVPDDVDDLDGHSETGPTDLAGTTFAGAWRRTWAVTTVDLDDPQRAVAAGSTSLLRVRIGIEYQSAEIATETLWLARTP